MGRSDRRSPQQRGRKQSRGGRERPELPPLNDEQLAALSDLTARTTALAGELRAAQSGGRDALIATLAPLDQQDEPVMLEYAAQLGSLRGAVGRDAADVAQALGELDIRRQVAREARRSRLRLRSAGFPSSLTIPSGPPSIMATDGFDLTPPPTPITAISRLTRWRKQLVEALATRSRESGEVALVLGWQEGIDPDTVRGYSLGLDFWRSGVSGYSVSEPMSRKRFQREIAESLQMDDQHVPTVRLTWAGARRLLQEALEANAWRGIELDKEFQSHRALIEERLLAEPDESDDDTRAAIAEEEARFAREGDRSFIRTDMEPEETLANWLGAWCFGDYGLTWDFLSNDNPLRRGSTREEYVALRRQWAGEADPGALRLTLIREQPQRASALWVPGAVGRLAGSAAKELEAFWSVVLHETALAGQLDEMPMATLTSQETGRHWYWTAYTISRDTTSGLWTIGKMRDEGAASQALTMDELQKRIKETRESAEQTAQTVPENPRDPRTMDVVRAVTGSLATVLHYDDALIVKLPLDESVYRSAIDDARTMNNHERAAALLERMLGRFPNQVRTRFELGVEQYLTADQYANQGEQEAAANWLDRAIATMTTVTEQERTAEHLQGLAELLAQRGRSEEAEKNLREALTLDATRASTHADLASVLMARVSEEHADEPEKAFAGNPPPIVRESLAELREAARLDSALPGIFTRMGAIYEMLGQPEDARLSYEEAIQREAEDATAHYALGSLLLSRKQDDAALPHLEAAVRIEPLAVTFRIGLATGLVAVGRTRDANRELDLIDRLQPDLPQVRELRAILARQQHEK